MFLCPMSMFASKLLSFDTSGNEWVIMQENPHYFRISHSTTTKQHDMLGLKHFHIVKTFFHSSAEKVCLMKCFIIYHIFGKPCSNFFSPEQHLLEKKNFVGFHIQKIWLLSSINLFMLKMVESHVQNIFEIHPVHFVSFMALFWLVFLMLSNERSAHSSISIIHPSV